MIEEKSVLDNKFLLTMMVAKRAKQLNQGFKPLAEVDVKNNRLVALKEIREGKVYVKSEKEDEQTIQAQAKQDDEQTNE